MNKLIYMMYIKELFLSLKKNDKKECFVLKTFLRKVAALKTATFFDFLTKAHYILWNSGYKNK